MIEYSQAVQKKLYHQIPQVEISDLPVEIHAMIFAHVHDLRQVRRMGEACRCWQALSQSVEENCMKNASHLDVEAISFLAMFLIMKRTKPQDDLIITRFCTKAALAAGTKFDYVNPTTQMVVTIGRLYNENPHRALEDLKKTEIKKCIVDAANTDNAYAKFILGLVNIKDTNFEDIFFNIADSRLKRALNCGTNFFREKFAPLRRKLPFKRKNKTKTEQDNPPAKQNLLFEAYNQDVYDAGYFLPDLSKDFMGDFLYDTIKEAAKRGSVLAAVVWFNWDSEGAYEYLVQAAKNKHAPAQYLLGKTLYNNHLEAPKTVEEKQKEITFWFGNAALQNHPAAQIMLGNLIARDFEDAQGYLEQMKKNNLDTVHVEHGIRFFKVNESNSESYFSLYLSSDSQDFAYSNLSLIYFSGAHVEKDIEKAKEYASKCTLLTQSRLMKYFDEFR